MSTSSDEQSTISSLVHDRHKHVFATTAALCLGMFTHSFLLISVFPYSAFLAIHLLDGVTEETAGKYAGFIASSFMVGRAVTSFMWGKAADRYGRTTVLHLSLILSCIFSIMFGFTAKSYSATLFVRFLLGCSNGIMAAIKTVVSEISDETNEARTMGFVIGMWGWGFLVSPVVSGALSDPVKQYPNLYILQEGTFAGDVMRSFPFLLPNLLGALMCLVSIIFIKMFINETLHKDRRRSVIEDAFRCIRHFQCFVPGYRYQSLPVLKTLESEIFPAIEENHETIEKTSFREDSLSASMLSLLSRKDTQRCLAIFWVYSFVGLAVDELFPLFCTSKVAGFGLSEKDIGKILSACGLVFALVQYGVYNTVYNRYGLYGSIRIGSLFSAPLLLVIPISLPLNRGALMGELKWASFLFLSGTLAVHRCFSLVFFSSISVATNRTVPSHERASMNGLTVLGGSVAKALGPAFAGMLTTASVSWLGRYASLLMFGFIGSFGLFVTASAFLYLPNDEENKSKWNDDELTQSIELHETKKVEK
jgi:MFS family permease